MITDREGNRVTLVHWTDGVDAVTEIHCGVTLLRFDRPQARKLANELKRKDLLLRRAVAALQSLDGGELT